MSQTEKQLAHALIKACEAALQKSPSGNVKAVTDVLQAAKEFYGIRDNHIRRSQGQSGLQV